MKVDQHIRVKVKALYWLEFLFIIEKPKMSLTFPFKQARLKQ